MKPCCEIHFNLGHCWKFITGRNEVVAKVIFLHLSVIHSIHWGMKGSASVHAGIPPPWEQTPPRSRPPPQEQTSPRADTPWEQTPPGADTPISLGVDHPPLGADIPGRRHPLEADTPPGADTHPHPPWEQTIPPEQTPIHSPEEDTPPGEDTVRNRHPPEQTPTPPGADTPPDQTRPPQSRLQHTVYERPVLILLECILV